VGGKVYKGHWRRLFARQFDENPRRRVGRHPNRRMEEQRTEQRGRRVVAGKVKGQSGVIREKKRTVDWGQRGGENPRRSRACFSCSGSFGKGGIGPPEQEEFNRAHRGGKMSNSPSS